MASTRIEWTEASWNPVTVCTKISAGCKNCYAEQMAKQPMIKQMSRESAEGKDESAAGRGGSGRYLLSRKKNNGQVGPFSGVRWVQGWPVLTCHMKPLVFQYIVFYSIF